MADEDKTKGEKPASESEDQGADESGVAGLKSALAKEREAHRKWEAEAKTNAEAAKKLTEMEDSKKSDLQLAQDKVTAAEAKAAEAEHRALRLEVAVTKSLTPALAKRLVGTTREELESDADELLSTLGGTPAVEAAKGAADKTTTTGGTRGRPTEKLLPGAVPSAEAVEMDPAKLAAKIPRDY
jgi:hypothetical protein